jgi:DNA polymerase bacteriophage-type
LSIFMPILFRDYETRGVLNLTKVGAWRYASHPDTDVWCCAYAVDDGPVSVWAPGDPVPLEFVEAANNTEWIVSAFNDAFERLIEQHIMAPRYGWPLMPIDRHRCSQAAALALSLPAKLETVAAVLGLAEQKDKAGAALMRAMAKPRKPREGEDPSGLYWHDDPERLARLCAYCKQDTVVERALHAHTGHLPIDEQQLWQLDAIINDRGIPIDVKLTEAAIRLGRDAQAAINAELSAVTAGAVETVGQTEKLMAWLAANDCVVKDVQKGALKQALRRTKISDATRRVMELRLDGAHAAAAKYQRIKSWVGADNRVRGAFKYHGAATGRWTSLGVQVQNLKKPTVEDLGAAIEAVATGDLDHVKQLYPQPMSVIGDVARAVICAAPGHRFIAADFSGVESRLTAWLAGEQSKIGQWAKFDQTGKPEDEPYYVLGKLSGFPEEQARALGKTADLAFGYGGGEGAWRKLAPEEDAATLDQIKARQRAWRNAHPTICQLWRSLEREAIRAVKNPRKVCVANDKLAFKYEGDFLRMRLPNGRKIAYPFPRLQTNDRGDAVVIFKDNAGGKWVDNNHGRGAWGGIWVENAVQATARDLFAAAMLRLEAAGYPVTLHVHDEIVAEVPDGVGSTEDFLKILIEAPAWAMGLPIAAKVRNGPRFCKIKSPQKPAAEAAPHAEAPPDDGVSDLWREPSQDETEATPTPQPEPRTNGADAHIHKDDDDDGAADSSGDGYPHGERDTGHQLAFFIYKHADGRPYLGVKKTSTKQFPQYHWTGSGWSLGPPKGPKIPYRLPELIKTPLNAWVLICAGEKDAETAAALGFAATTNPEGERKGAWAPELNAWFAGRKHIAVMEDNDATGRAHVIEVADALRGIIPDIRIVTFRDLAEHGDLTEWKERGHGRDDLQAKIGATKPYQPKPQPSPIRQWDGDPVPELEYSVPDRYPMDNVGLFSGEGGQGKSSLVQQLCVAHVLAREWLGCTPRQGPALYIECEDAENVLHWRVKAIAAHYGASLADIEDAGFQMFPLTDEENAVLATAPDKTGIVRPTPLYDWLYELAGDLKPVMIGIASSANVFAGNENVRTEVQQFIRLLRRVACVAHGTVLLVTQPSLTGIENKSASHEGLAGTTQWHNGVRARAVMKAVKPEDGVDTGLRAVTFHKNQYGPASATCFVRYAGGLFLPVEGMSIDAAERAAKVEEVFIALLKRFTQQRQMVSPKTSATYAPSRFAEHPEAGGITKKEFARAMQRLLDAKIIEIRDWGRPSRPHHYLALAGES